MINWRRKLSLQKERKRREKKIIPRGLKSFDWKSRAYQKQRTFLSTSNLSHGRRFLWGNFSTFPVYYFLPSPFQLTGNNSYCRNKIYLHFSLLSLNISNVIKDIRLIAYYMAPCTHSHFRYSGLRQKRNFSSLTILLHIV